MFLFQRSGIFRALFVNELLIPEYVFVFSLEREQ